MKALLETRRRKTPAPRELDVESVVRERLYGERTDVTATPIRGETVTRVGSRYRLLEPLGAGRTAEVYRARDERLQRDVAVKVIAEPLAHDAAAVRLFRREAELWARLAHRNVAAVLDAGSRPREYIVMELVDGPDLGALPTASAPAVVLQIREALEHAHGRGVIHGDVAPRNILIARRDGTAKLIDLWQAVEGFDGDSDLEALNVIVYGLVEAHDGLAPLRAA